MTDEIKDPIEQEPVPSTEGGEGNPAEKCPHCERREEEQAQMEDLNLAILIALVPALTITLFSNMGLF